MRQGSINAHAQSRNSPLIHKSIEFSGFASYDQVTAWSIRVAAIVGISAYIQPTKCGKLSQFSDDFFPQNKLKKCGTFSQKMRGKKAKCLISPHDCRTVDSPMTYYLDHGR